MSNRMTMRHILIGDEKGLTAQITDESGVPVDPDALALTIKAPDGTVSTVSLSDLTHVATGSYRHNMIVDQPGIWSAYWSATGSVVAAGEATLIVDSSRAFVS